MRDINRIDDILKRINKIWKQYPDLRLGQLIINLESICDIPLYYLEDEELINALENFYIKKVKN